MQIDLEVTSVDDVKFQTQEIIQENQLTVMRERCKGIEQIESDVADCSEVMNKLACMISAQGKSIGKLQLLINK